MILAVDPIEQFQIHNLFPVAKIGNTEIAFTNSAAFMLVAVFGLTFFLVGATAGGRLVPTRLQSAAEIAYEFVATTVRSTAGSEGMRFFPFVFSIFMFVLTLNMIGLIPYSFTVTSHIIVTAALALTVFFTVLIYGLIRHGFHFFNSVRAEGRADLHSAADRGDRDPVVPVAADLAQRASVRQHAGRPHHAAGVRQLHHPARHRLGRHRLDRRRAAVLDDCAFCSRWRRWSPSCRPTSSPSSPASISTMRYTRATEAPASKKELVMDPVAAKYIGAGIACIGMGGAGVGVGIIFGNYLAAALRNPSAAQGQFGNLIFGFAITEALGIFSLLIALLLLFAL